MVEDKEIWLDIGIAQLSSALLKAISKRKTSKNINERTKNQINEENNIKEKVEKKCVPSIKMSFAVTQRNPFFVINNSWTDRKRKWKILCYTHTYKLFIYLK